MFVQKAKFADIDKRRIHAERIRPAIDASGKPAVMVQLGTFLRVYREDEALHHANTMIDALETARHHTELEGNTPCKTS